MIRNRPFSGAINEDPYHLQEFEELVFMLGNPRHDTGLVMEIVSFLSYKKGGAVVHLHDTEYER